jgi:hypothetical protein
MRTFYALDACSCEVWLLGDFATWVKAADHWDSAPSYRIGVAIVDAEALRKLGQSLNDMGLT